MNYIVKHTKLGDFPIWRHLDSYTILACARYRAYHYHLDYGGYVCVQDSNGDTVYGTDPIELNRAITAGSNRHFIKTGTR